MVKFLLLFFLLNVSFFGQDISVKASADSSNFKIGDFIKYKVEIKYPNNYEIFFPSIKDSLKNIEFISNDTIITQTENNFKEQIYLFTLAGYDSGNFVIPSYSIFYKEKNDTALKLIKTDSIKVTIHSLKVDTSLEIKDIKEPIKIPLDWKLILLWVLIIAVAAAIVYFIYKKIRSRRKSNLEIEEIKLLPHELALKSLKELEQKQLWQKGLIKEYHTEITEIVRRYFEEKFSLKALELTTHEVLDQLKQLKERDLIFDITESFLNNADMVKFAKFIPFNNINEEMMKQAFQIVESTVDTNSGQLKQENKDVQS